MKLYLQLENNNKIVGILNNPTDLLHLNEEEKAIELQQSIDISCYPIVEYEYNGENCVELLGKLLTNNVISDDLEQIKKEKITEINDNYQLALKEGFLYDGIVYKIKKETISDLSSKIEICEELNDFKFCNIDLLSKAGLELLLKNMRIFVNNSYYSKKSLEEQINGCTTIEEVNNIIIN